VDVLNKWFEVWPHKAIAVGRDTALSVHLVRPDDVNLHLLQQPDVPGKELGCDLCFQFPCVRPSGCTEGCCCSRWVCANIGSAA